MNELRLAPEHGTGLKKSELLLKRMQEAGIEKNSGNDHQYIKAKRLIEDLSENSQEYENLIRIVVDYINI